MSVKRCSGRFGSQDFRSFFEGLIVRQPGYKCVSLVFQIRTRRTCVTEMGATCVCEAAVWNLGLSLLASGVRRCVFCCQAAISMRCAGLASAQ